MTNAKVSGLVEASTHKPKLAKIREEECIGCTKCLKACPVDAIFGALNYMHVVITEECIGCELCVAPCPVDCIELIPVHELQYNKYKARDRAKQKIQREKTAPTKPNEVERKIFLKDAIARAKAKKIHSGGNKTHE